MIEVEAIHRRFGSLEALHDVTFRVDQGQVLGLLGPNGAGKTTLLRILAGVLAPTSGRARVAGHDTLLASELAQQRVGWLPEGAPAYEDMPVEAFLVFVARARGLGTAAAAHACARALEACGLAEHLKQVVGTLSRGTRQRVGLAQAIVHDPAVLILDEPTTGLDPNQVVEMRELVRAVGEQRTVLMSSHVLSEVQAVCDRVVILHQGRVVADDRTEQITLSARGASCRVALGPSKVKASEASLVAQLREVGGVLRVEALTPGEHGPRFRIHAEHDVRAEVFRWAADRGHVLVELAEERRSLEAVFRSLTEAA